MEKTRDQPTRTESKTRILEQIDLCLGSGNYSRALDLLHSTHTEFPDDADLSELERRAQEGVNRKAEAQRLITESQELFSQQKSKEALELLRKAYALDKNNSLARSILANALVEHAQSLLETDWLEAETHTNQALSLNPAHPTAKTILNLIVSKKETSSVDEWIAQASKLQSSGDLFVALGWVAEGLAVHPHDPKLLQIQSAIQRDQDSRRRQARRGDVEELRRLQREIDGAADAAAKQTLAVRIQTIAAKHWTDGEILSIANALLLRLGLVAQDSSSGSLRSKGATVILHVPRPSAPKPASADGGQAPPVITSPSPAMPTQASPSQTSPSPASASPALASRVLPSEVAPRDVPPKEVPKEVRPNFIPPEEVATAAALPSPDPPSVPQPRQVPLRTPPRGRVHTPPPEPELLPPPAAEPRAPAAKVASLASRSKEPAKANATTLILFVAAAIILVAATFYFTRQHYAPQVAKGPAAVPSTSAPTVPSPAASTSSPAVSAPDVPTASTPAPAETTSGPSLPASRPPSDSGGRKAALDDQPPSSTSRDVGTLVIVAGQDEARVLLNGKPRAQLTQGGQLRLPNLETEDYVVQVSKNGFQDPPAQNVRIRKGEEVRLIFNLQALPRLASLTIQGGAPGTAVLVDQALVGTLQRDGTLSVSTVNPGDHIVELRKEQFQPRQFKEHFVAGGAIFLAASDATLEPAPGELKITFVPPDAKVAIVNGDHVKTVSSGVPFDLAAGTYTLTTRTADRFTRWQTLQITGGQSKALDLSLAPSGMSRWDDPGAWKPEKDSFLCKGGDFVLYGVSPASGTFVFSAMPVKGHILQWVLNYTDPKNYVLFQMDENGFSRAVIRNGEKTDEVRVPDKSEKKSFRTLQVHVSPTEIVHQINRGNGVTFLDHWTQPGTNLSLGKFGFYIPGNDEVELSTFNYYADLNIR